MVLQRTREVPLSTSQESSLSNVRNQHSGMRHGVTRDHGTKHLFHNATGPIRIQGGKNSSQPSTQQFMSRWVGMYNPKSIIHGVDMQQRIHHHLETSNEWFKCRRNWTVKCTILKYFIETMIRRANNSLSSPQRREHQHNKRRSGSNASSNGRERGVGSEKYRLRHSSGRRWIMD